MKQFYFLKCGLLLCLLFTAMGVYAQSGTISGTVTDEANKALPGAAVSLKGTTNTVLSDMNGKYTLYRVPDGLQTVSVRFIGYELLEKEVQVSGNSQLNFQLMPSATSLGEVVVTGYGTQRRQDVTGAVSSISAKDLNPGPITNPLQQIAGKAAGVSITQVGSEPGSAPSVRIRGITSLIGGNDPLIVVDGIQGGMDLLRQVPPSEIENVDILKDASATAIYGSRGAPGVIIVTTKKSRAGTTSVEYNAVSSVDAVSKQLDLLSADEWWTEAQRWGVTAASNHGANTDWFGLLTRNGTTQNHNLAIGGGSNSFNYRASVNAIMQQGIVLRSDNQNYIARLQATQKALDDKLTINMNISSSFRNNTGSGNGGNVGRAAFRSNLISNAYISRPTDPVYNLDGSYFIDKGLFEPINPYAYAQEVQNDGRVADMVGSLSANVDLFRDLSAGVFGSWRKVDSNDSFFLPPSSTDATAINENGNANIWDRRQNERLFNFNLKYNKAFGNHQVDVTGVYEWQQQLYQGNGTSVRNIPNIALSYNNFQSADPTKTRPGDFQSYKDDRTNISFLGRVNYAFLGRYLLTASLRRDGSSVFGANHKWGNFPSASIGWRIDQEPFMADQNIFSSLKLRGGFGVTGNQQGLRAQQSLELVGVGSPSTVFFGGQTITNYVTTQNANPDLRWETKEQINIGLDFALLSDRLRGTFDAFTADTKNLLYNYSVAVPPFEYNQITANVGTIRNRGLEASLAYDLIRSENTTLTIAGNGALLRNKVLKLSGNLGENLLNTNYVGMTTPGAFLIEGHPVGTYNMLQHNGIDPATGLELIVDQDNNGTIDQGAESPDRVLEGGALPTFTYAFTPSLTHKNLDVSMIWRGSGGNQIYNSVRQSLSLMENIGKSNILESAIYTGMFSTPYASDFWLEDGDFLRFENLTIGYRFNVANNKYIKGLRASVTGNNLAIFTKYSGIDPEVTVNGGNGAGRDNGLYPRVRSFALGLNIILN